MNRLLPLALGVILAAVAGWILWSRPDPPAESAGASSAPTSASGQNASPPRDRPTRPTQGSKSDTPRSGGRPTNRFVDVPPLLLDTLFQDPDSVSVKQSEFKATPYSDDPAARAEANLTWTITAYCNEASLERLTFLNTQEGMQQVFEAVFRETKDERFRTDLPERDLRVNMIASENKAFDPLQTANPDPATRFRLLVKLTITQQSNAPAKAEEPKQTPPPAPLPPLPPPPPPAQ